MYIVYMAGRRPRQKAKNDARQQLCQALVVTLPEVGESFCLDPTHVRRNDTSTRSINEWTGEKLLRDEDVPDDVRPMDVQPLGNYAVQVR